MHEQRYFIVLTLASWSLVGFLLAGRLIAEEPPSAEQGANTPQRSKGQVEHPSSLPNNTGPYPYDLTFQLDVEGQVSLLSTTRYCRSEDLHLKTVARMEKGYWQFDTVGLSTGHHDLNFGIGEGPKRHQRYILLDEPPSNEEVSRIRKRILMAEGRTPCLADQPQGVGDGPDTGIDSEQEDSGEGKKAYFNFYLWKGPHKGLSFSQTYDGAIRVVENNVDVVPIMREGGRRAKPRFFETLQYALRAIPPFADSSSGSLALSDSGWQVSLQPVMEGLVNLCREVYGRKMTLLDPKAVGAQKINYVSHRVSGTPVVEVTGSIDNGPPTGIRVSGFKGEIWIKSFRRVVLLDSTTGRILKDDLQFEFGIERNATILALKGQKNHIHITLVDQCFLGCPDSDTGIVSAVRTCSAATPEL